MFTDNKALQSLRMMTIHASSQFEMCYQPTPHAVPSKIDFPHPSITNSIGFVNSYQNIICLPFIDHTKEDHPCQHIFLTRNCPLDL